MGRICAGFEINEHYLIFAFQYFFKGDKGTLDVEEYLFKYYINLELFRVEMARYVAEYNWDINSKLFFRCLFLLC